MTKLPALKMNNGQTVPQIGFGMWKILPGFTARKSVGFALEAGYRHFDTAQVYHNEQHLGKAILESGVRRQDVFITTKIASGSIMHNLSVEKLIPSFQDSLNNLQTDYVDLLLIHFPASDTRRQAWPEVEKIYKSGRAKSIGVSNYTVRHLEELLSQCKIKPAVNQVELHVYLQQPELLDYCQKQGIVVEAYSPLAHGKKMDNPVLEKIAAKHNKSIAQIMIRWCIDVGTIPLPKSTHDYRMKQNIDVFDFKLDTEDLGNIVKLNENLRTCWDPTDVP